MKTLKGTFTDEKGNKYTGELEYEENGKRWRAEEGEDYMYIDEWGELVSGGETSHTADDFRHLTRNYFKTKEEAQKHLDRILAEARLRDAVDTYNDGWVADWNSCFEIKYEIRYDYFGNRFYFNGWTTSRNANAFYLKDENEAFLKEHEADLRLVWGV